MGKTAFYAGHDQIGFVLRRVSQRHLALFSETIHEVTTRPDPEDCRRLTVGPSAAGGEPYRSLVADAPNMSAATLEPLSPSEQGQLLALFGRLF